MVATSIITASERTGAKNHSMKVSTSFYYSDNEEVTVPSQTPIIKKHSLDTLPRTPKRAPRTSISAEEWSFYTMAPRPSKRQTTYMSEECLRDAPPLPFLDNDENGCSEDTMNLTRPPLRLLPSLNNYFAMDNRQIPYLDDWINNKVDEDDNQKENIPPATYAKFLK